MRIPPTLLYSPQHLWAKPTSNGVWEAGITDYAQDLLGDIVFIEPPSIGTALAAGKTCGLVESVKTGSDLHALVDGDVVEINQALLNNPELMNEDPYQAWIFKFTPHGDALENQLMSATDYKIYIDGL
jgi:glycine cleavage system H protein